MKVVKTRRGARLLHEGHVVSEVLSSPGPTHSIFDVLAAAACLHDTAQHLALLGFAGGGVVAPLRAMGFDAPIHAVDLWVEAEPVFRELCGPWAKEVELTKEDALVWLRDVRQVFDVIVEDLSMQIPDDVTKPDVSLKALPKAIARKRTSNGWVIVNALPVKGYSWRELTQSLTRPFRHVLEIHVEGFANRILVAGPKPMKAREVSLKLRFFLEAIGSNLAHQVSVRNAVSVASISRRHRG